MLITRERKERKPVGYRFECDYCGCEYILVFGCDTIKPINVLREDGSPAIFYEHRECPNCHIEEDRLATPVYEDELKIIEDEA